MPIQRINSPELKAYLLHNWYIDTIQIQQSHVPISIYSFKFLSSHIVISTLIVRRLHRQTDQLSKWQTPDESYRNSTNSNNKLPSSSILMVSWNAPLQVYDYCRCWCLTMHVFLMWSVYRCSINYIFFKSFPSTLLLYGSSHLKGIHFISLTVFLWSNIKCGLHCMPSILIHAAISESYWIEFSSFSVNNTVLLWSHDFSKDSCCHLRIQFFHSGCIHRSVYKLLVFVVMDQRGFIPSFANTHLSLWGRSIFPSLSDHYQL